MTWSEELSVDVAEIDAQHQELIQLLNELFDAVKKGRGRDIVETVVDRMADYTKFHFGIEEKYFDELGYPDAKMHKMEHQVFIDRVAEFRTQIGAGELGVSIRILRFLGDWIGDHIQGSDMKYSKFFNDKGLF